MVDYAGVQQYRCCASLAGKYSQVQWSQDGPWWTTRWRFYRHGAKKPLQENTNCDKKITVGIKILRKKFVARIFCRKNKSPPRETKTNMRMKNEREKNNAHVWKVFFPVRSLVVIVGKINCCWMKPWRSPQSVAQGLLLVVASMCLDAFVAWTNFVLVQDEKKWHKR